jgi:hypothetical protein
MKTTSSGVLNSKAILDAIRSRESEILFEFHDNSWLFAYSEKSYKSECQEKYLPVGSVSTLFLSRHSAQLFERARAIDEWSSSDDLVSCFVRFCFLPVVPFYFVTAPFVSGN